MIEIIRLFMGYRIALVLIVIFLATRGTVSAQTPVTPDPDEACKPYTSAVVWLGHIAAINGRISQPDTYFGSGFVVSGDGLIVTAAHVVIPKGAKEYRRDIEAIVPNVYHGHQLESNWVSATPVTTVEDALKHDVAILKVNATKGPFRESLDTLTLDEDGSAQKGAKIILIGYPGSLTKKCELGTVVNVNGYQIVYKGVSIGGLSGGPMISLENGKVVGIVQCGYSLGRTSLPTGEGCGIDVAAIHTVLQKAQK